MFFGLPWFAIVAIVSTVVVFLFAYKSKELEVEEKIQVKAREVHDLEKLVHNLKSRLDEVENKLNNQSAGQSSSRSPNTSTSQIEINDEFESQNPDNIKDSNSKRVNS